MCESLSDVTLMEYGVSRTGCATNDYLLVVMVQRKPFTVVVSRRPC